MKKLPTLSGEEVVKALLKAGFRVVSIRGSHVKLKSDGKVVVVPLHKELAKGTLISVLRQAGLTKDDLLELLEAL